MDKERLVTLYQAGRTVASLWELEKLLARLMDLVLITLPAERGLILLAGKDDGDLAVEAARNVGGKTIEDAADFSRTVVTLSVDEARAVYSRDAQREFSMFESIVEYKIISFICVPLKLPEQVIGAIYVDSRDPTKVFTSDDVDFLASLAYMAAPAIGSARLHGERTEEIATLRSALRTRDRSIVGRSPAIGRVLDSIARVAKSNVSVVISGESGTGKELVARAIHMTGPRASKPFVPCNCAAIPTDLLESELFGYKRGAFTGAIRDKKGLFEEADGGTLFMDEIGDLSSYTQAKLLRVLQEGEIRRVGDTEPRRVDVRIISATNKDIEKEVAEKRIREDLYYRLNVFSIHIPPLRDRPEDIPLLVDHLLRDADGKRRKGITPSALDLLCRQRWPGNVRELENVIERAIVLADEDMIAVEHLPDLSLPDGLRIDLHQTLERIGQEGKCHAIERGIRAALAATGGDMRAAADRLGVGQSTLYRWCHKLGIERGRRPYRRSGNERHERT
ncbi:hypothetical protein AMJ39_03155 [candidate division TA06 bacterium DG_24]|uniref:Sigma-54 factor interaction domain-containing protein n=3 Tax=Bacteria division TA06 TaxID=1156500 RepID=A0A0S8JLK2_UNCT6|nr:MAG: hypothetical protein AMJ39_03155 [candidate division TA06 bacterium DG_24]KPK70784.1 MAG: hypothetical protein AMJ82_02380 [candidate division TA06 bacterium SM23_40]KPL09515.1 MAG: hypothetical protein AMJ71_06185 [candidate division TA06 bacterium SM1_40]